MQGSLHLGVLSKIRVRLRLNCCGLLQFASYTSFVDKNGVEPVLGYPSIWSHLSTYLYANSSHLKINLYPK